MGRPKIDMKKDKGIRIRLNEEDYLWMRLAAEVRGTNVSKLLRTAFQEYLKTFSNDELFWIQDIVYEKSEVHLSEEISCDTCQYMNGEDWCGIKCLQPCDKRIFCDEYEPKRA